MKLLVVVHMDLIHDGLVGTTVEAEELLREVRYLRRLGRRLKCKPGHRSHRPSSKLLWRRRKNVSTRRDRLPAEFPKTS